MEACNFTKVTTYQNKKRLYSKDKFITSEKNLPIVFLSTLIHRNVKLRSETEPRPACFTCYSHFMDPNHLLSPIMSFKQPHSYSVWYNSNRGLVNTSPFFLMHFNFLFLVQQQSARFEHVTQWLMTASLSTHQNICNFTPVLKKNPQPAAACPCTGREALSILPGTQMMFVIKFFSFFSFFFFEGRRVWWIYRRADDPSPHAVSNRGALQWELGFFLPSLLLFCEWIFKV